VKKERAMKRWTPLLVATIVSMTVPAFSQEKVVHFSSINGQTGQSAAYGSKVIEGVDLAAKAINDAGGFADKCGTRYKLKITTGDMANSREQAVSLLRQAASDASVLAVVGPSPSTGYVPMVPVAGQLKIPIIATGSGAPIKEWNPWAFRLNTVSTVAVPTLMRTLKAKFGVKRVALIYDVTQDGQRGEAELIKNAAKDIGYEVVAFEAFRAGDNDFRPQLSKIKAVKPDWIGIYGATPELAKVVNQMAELDIKAEMLTGFGTFNDPVVWDLTEGRVKGGYSWSAYFALEDPARPAVGKMVQAYKKEYTHDPTLYSFYGWDAVHVYVEAVKRACTPTDRDKFRQVLNTIHNFPTLSGQATFKNPPDGENLSAAVIVNQTTGRGAFEAVK
jgi:branched-chain amino acid transport system substrate-binding protein